MKSVLIEKVEDAIRDTEAEAGRNQKIADEHAEIARSLRHRADKLREELGLYRRALGLIDDRPCKENGEVNWD